MTRAIPFPEKENIVLTKDLVRKLTEDHNNAMLRTLKLADDMAPGDSGVQLAIMHTACLNSICALFLYYTAGHEVKDKDLLGAQGKAVYAQMITDLVKSGWRYINHQMKD